jgi:hypothetical protein
LLEPVNREDEFFGWRLPDAQDLAAAVARVYEPPPGVADPMRRLSVADLVGAAEGAALEDVTVSVTVMSRTSPKGDDALVRRVLHAQPNPNSPTVADAAAQALCSPDAERFLALLDHAVRRGEGRTRQATALLTARRSF